MCVVRMGGLGDLIFLSSSLREWRLRNPDTFLTLATTEGHLGFMQSLGIADNVIPMNNLAHLRFEKTIDLRLAVEPPEVVPRGRGDWSDYVTKARSDIFDELLGVYPCPKRFEIPVNPSILRIMKKALDGWGVKDFVLLNCAVIAQARAIPLRYVEPLCKEIVKLGLHVILTGTSFAWNIPLMNIAGEGIVNLIHRTTIPELIALASLSSLVVTSDTGTLHIGGALGKRTIGIFGNIDPATRISYYPSVRAIHPAGELDCIPCWDVHPCTTGGCKDPKCMELLTPEWIMEAVQEEWAKIHV